ncbi:RNA polymerase sigma-70 factor (ECF subfamily) [Thermosporothrix hazakensis]|jgi:RNA polymerase sigma-70 factor (ECF subfamily)|uniref:RNA polymerase sigma-70 factor (ECF subfamily) n=2 Tax=Thermosporothrix TaxID=768650 RepID=A0A326USH7_THEHA|nr:sigma-70 family RNA polymerase sigma factor [Thermosporothrix hazakensis]PZW36819.1 RNA polymerase sigma-70 factor (ECF subfamily) [Thermosporothrix hazakensis]BBH89285.1 DNA-directed RNA polymerase sigma-70 factor [Thermosporothrix sp. COM3]GCE47468.1 DNA-directed RNA polymerase sigma-70 factor [Thermosporothrix hazakensis]
MQQSLSVHDMKAADLYQKYSVNLFAYLRLHLASREDAEDMLVEIFLAALENEKLKDLGEDYQRRWLWRVAHNKVADYYRSREKRQAVALETVTDSMYEDEELAPERLAERGEDYARLYALIRQLPDIQRRVLELRFVQGMRCREIAELVGKREGNVRMLISRALNLLRALYQEARRENGQ